MKLQLLGFSWRPPKTVPHSFSSVSQMRLPIVKISPGETCHQKLQVLSHTFKWKKKKNSPTPSQLLLLAGNSLNKTNNFENLSRVPLTLVRTVLPTFGYKIWFSSQSLVVLAKAHAGSHAAHHGGDCGAWWLQGMSQRVLHFHLCWATQLSNPADESLGYHWLKGRIWGQI